MIGQRLSQFEITAKLGEGGMGVVYRARDTKLGRDVAIKMLPEELTADPERMARFEREARVLASLNHPSIATIHDLKEADGSHFLVMELVEGEDLAAVLGRGAIPQAKALHIALQLADALETTHGLGVVHRDLKPGNIMVGPNDHIKVLDFGLAKATGNDADTADLTHSPTRTAPMTKAGLILGTAGYMSPEQARGQPVDKQADIWAFGVVLWEMLTSEPLIQGDSIADMMVAVLKGEFDWDELPQDTPTGIRRLLERCLQREPRQRLHDMGDARLEVEAAMEGEEDEVAEAAEARPTWSWAAAAAVAIATLAVVLGIRSCDGEGPGEVYRTDLVAPAGFHYGRVGDGNLTLSPSGHRLAYISAPGDFSLVVHDFTTGEFRILVERGDHLSFPFWSPDGQWVGFFADEKLKKIPVDGGPAQIVADARNGRGGNWGPDGTIVFAPEAQAGLLRVSDGGGPSQPVTEAPGEGVSHRQPRFLPDGEHFLFTEMGDGGQAAIALGSLEEDTHTVLIERGSNAEYADGHLFFVRDRNLMAQPFDSRRLELSGSPQLVADAIAHNADRAIGNFSVSAAGLLAYRQRRGRQTQVFTLDKDGSAPRAIGEPDLFTQILGISDDESRLALQRLDGTELYHDVWILDMERGQLTRATTIATPGAQEATFSGSGERLAIRSSAGQRGEGGLWLQSTSGGGETRSIPVPLSFWLWDWSRDDRYLFGALTGEGTRFDIYYIDLEDDDPEPHLFVQSQYGDLDPQLSPDGRWLAYISNETEKNELYVTGFPSGTDKWLVSQTQGGEYRAFVWRWSGDGRKLHYSNATGIYQVAFEGTDPPTIGPPELLVATDPVAFADVYWVAGVLDDRILALKYVTEPTVEPVRLVRNWQRLLED